MKARLPKYRLVRLIWELNRECRPEWEPIVLAWFRKNGMELELGE